MRGSITKVLACKPCSCPAFRLKKEPRDSYRDIRSLLDGDLTCLQQKGLERHPCVWSRQEAGHGSHTPYSGEEEATTYRGK